MIDATDLTVAELLEVDLLDPATFVDYDLTSLFRTLRQRLPVFAHPSGFWVVTRYADVLATYKDPATFASRHGNVLSTLVAGGDRAGDRMLVVTDPPDHRRLRAAMNEALSRHTMEGLEARLRERTSELVRRVADGRVFDFATEVAENLPMTTICDLMEVPEPDRPELLAWNKQALSSDTETGTEQDAMFARAEILTYLSGLVQERRAAPGRDVVSALMDAGGGEPLTDDEVVYNCYSLLIGGDESSRMSAVCGVLALAQHPQEWRLLREGAVRTDLAVEEVIRWATPAMHVGRRTTRPVCVGGEWIGADEVVTLWNTSANRDETVFPEPDSFRLARDTNRHVAFGFGPHFCVGARLGRLELAVLLETLAAQVTRISLEGEPQRVYSNFLFGYSALPVAMS